MHIVRPDAGKGKGGDAGGFVDIGHLNQFRPGLGWRSLVFLEEILVVVDDESIGSFARHAIVLPIHLLHLDERLIVDLEPGRVRIFAIVDGSVDELIQAA